MTATHLFLVTGLCFAQASLPPALGVASQLPRLASARGDEGKCQVLLQWLESGKSETDAPATARRNRVAGGDLLRIFRDEPMLAVFGVTYDQGDPGWRSELHEEVMAKCLGETTRSRNIPMVRLPATRRQPDPQDTAPFAPYRALLHQAFLGQPGPFTPATVTQYVMTVRQQMAGAQRAMAEAAALDLSRASFDRLTALRQTAIRQANRLTAAERSAMEGYLSRRQSEIAQPLADTFLQQASRAARTLAAARSLQQDRAALAMVIQSLSVTARSAWESQYHGLIASMIEAPLQAELQKLNGIPDTLPGAQQLTSLKAVFDTSFADLADIPAVKAGAEEYARIRIRVLAASLSAWLREIEAMPLEAGPFAVKHRELESLFPVRQGSFAELYARYESPLQSRGQELRAKLATASQPPPTGQSAATGAASQPGSFTAKGLYHERDLMNLYAGNFADIEFDRTDLRFGGLFQHYLEGFGQQCQIPEAERVPMLATRCRVKYVRTGQCAESETYETGLFAKRDLYAAKKELDLTKIQDLGRGLSQTMTLVDPRNPMAAVSNMAAMAKQVMGDMRALVKLNGCDSPGLLRFEENLRLFALNQQPVRLDGRKAVSAVTTVIPGVPMPEQDFAKLIDALVTDDSRRWGAMARFVRGSITQASVHARDKDGRPLSVVAPYAWEGMGRSRGSVTLTFVDGVPECVRYSETSHVCHTPNRKIVAAYLDGAYSKQRQ